MRGRGGLHQGSGCGSCEALRTSSPCAAQRDAAAAMPPAPALNGPAHRDFSPVRRARARRTARTALRCSGSPQSRPGAGHPVLAVGTVGACMHSNTRMPPPWNQPQAGAGCGPWVASSSAGDRGLRIAPSDSPSGACLSSEHRQLAQRDAGHARASSARALDHRAAQSSRPQADRHRRGADGAGLRLRAGLRMRRTATGRVPSYPTSIALKPGPPRAA